MAEDLDFDEELGMAIANRWTLEQISLKNPPTARELYTALKEAAHE